MATISAQTRRRLVPNVTGDRTASAYEYGITNIEYTEFQRLGICDEAQAGGSRLSKFPANTNVLYVGLKASNAAM